MIFQKSEVILEKSFPFSTTWRILLRASSLKEIPKLVKLKIHFLTKPSHPCKACMSCGVLYCCARRPSLGYVLQQALE